MLLLNRKHFASIGIEVLSFLSYRALLSRFHPDIKHPDPDVVQVTPHKIPVIGFSATFRRHDSLALGSVFEHIVYHRDFLEMIKEQWYCFLSKVSISH
jgi:ATP-dependent helicase IRC3